MFVFLIFPLFLALPVFGFINYLPSLSQCDISHAEIPLPAGQAALLPPKENTSFIVVSIGVQNYTCTSAGNYSNIGAVAELFDISCLYGTVGFSTIQDTAIDIWNSFPPGVSIQQIIASLHNTTTPVILGQHYFTPDPNSATGSDPRYDFRSQGATAGDADAFVDTVKTGDLAAPTGKQDIDWVSLKSIGGSLADEVYRVETRQGQPPTSCTPGSPDIAVKYTSQYWLFGGSVKSNVTSY